MVAAHGHRRHDGQPEHQRGARPAEQRESLTAAARPVVLRPEHVVRGGQDEPGRPPEQGVGHVLAACQIVVDAETSDEMQVQWCNPAPRSQEVLEDAGRRHLLRVRAEQQGSILAGVEGAGQQEAG